MLLQIQIEIRGQLAPFLKRRDKMKYFCFICGKEIPEGKLIPLQVDEDTQEPVCIDCLEAEIKEREIDWPGAQ